MSAPSTPRSTRSASSTGDSPNILTPGRKIKAMIAAFDSDSEDEGQKSQPQRPVSKLGFGRPSIGLREPSQSHGSEDDEDEVVMPRGRMAARMQGGTTNDANSSEPKQTETAYARLSRALRNEKGQVRTPSQEDPASKDESSEDDLPSAGPKRGNNATTIARDSPDLDEESMHSPPREKSNSPLFVSSAAAPREITHEQGDGADDNIEGQPQKNARFLALVAQKRKEREEKERIEAEKKAARRAQAEQFSSELLSGEESAEDDAGSGRKLTQQAPPARKASKKALEEMSRETQRMSRNMQLAHQAQTKRKISKDSLFARFNFMQAEAPPAPEPVPTSSSTAGSQPSSDGEGPQKKNDTPHTSPMLEPSDKETTTAIGQNESSVNEMDISDEVPELPTLEESFAPAQNEKKVTAEPKSHFEDVNPKEPPVPARHVRVLMSRQEVARHQEDDSDSDLEVVTSPAKCRRIAAFENLPAKRMQEPGSMTKFKALAHLTSPTRRTTSMTSAELSASLLYRARQQAALERRERMEELRAKGIVIETAEDRAAMEDDVEDLVEKARKEADEIARQERKAAKKNGQTDEDEEDDDDYVLSGSDEEAYNAGEDDEDDEEEENDNGAREGLVEREADEGDESADDQTDVLSVAEIDVQATRRKRRVRVVSDDDDDEEEDHPPSTPVRSPVNAVDSSQRPKIPGLTTPSNMTMGLTQAFAGTLGDNDADSQPGSAAVPFSLPDPGQPAPGLRRDNSDVLVRDSQEQSFEHDFMAGYSQTVTRVSESPAHRAMSQYSQLPDPTQDEGFVFSPFDPSKRFKGTPPISTVDTVIAGQGQSPMAADKKGRHLRRGRAADTSAVDKKEEGDFEISANAFNVMKKAQKKSAVPFNKQNSNAKDVVDEAADESEDEYAGLGGASDDSDGEEDAYDRQMINDNSGEVVDEKQLAALNAVHQRDRDEKDVAKLLKDISSGALRRRRGADDDFDLDDSDDERLARRRAKQREFAKMRRALLADDKIGELADNPKKAAFFKAIEDREVEDDFDLEFLEEKEAGSQAESSQDVAPDEQSDGGANARQNRKRPLEPSAEDTTNRPPPHMRRTPASAMLKKPATLAEIRETLSFLTETAEYDSFHEDASLDEEDGAAAAEQEADTPGTEETQPEILRPPSRDDFPKPSHPRRTRGPVVDRLALLRQASSNSASASASGSRAGSASSKLAFHSAGGKDGPIGFQPPQLLRRVTTGSSSSSDASMSSSTSSKASHRVSKPAAAGLKKASAVNSYTAAREREREKALRLKQRKGGSNIAKLLDKHASGGLGALAGKGRWD